MGVCRDMNWGFKTPNPPTIPTLPVSLLSWELSSEKVFELYSGALVDQA